ncbi:MAG: transaldolase [Bdellovibrionales bacterium]|nr:transaldolase [Bdellovibrionales bacterium]
MSKNPAQQLHDYGQSVWYDNISRELLDNGEIKRLIGEWGVRGMTSNPTIFDAAIGKSSLYDAQLKDLSDKQLSTSLLFEELALQDIGRAADLLRPIYESSEGEDGFVSIEVSPLLARDTEGTVKEAERLAQRLDRPNVMIKIPGTPEGMPAIRACLEKGLSINITLLFSVQNHVEVMNTYCEALRARVKRNEPVDKIRSVASFFVSRVDTIVDAALEKIVKENKDPATVERARALMGRFGIANCKLAYQKFQDIFMGQQFADLRTAGAAVQRPLWASTSTKNPNYRDTIYVEELIGPHTVNTMPHATLEATVDHGKIAETLTKGVGEAERVRQELTDLGIDLDSLMLKLQEEGVEKFVQSFEQLSTTLDEKVGKLK